MHSTVYAHLTYCMKVNDSANKSARNTAICMIWTCRQLIAEMKPKSLKMYFMYVWSTYQSFRSRNNAYFQNHYWTLLIKLFFGSFLIGKYPFSLPNWRNSQWAIKNTDLIHLNFDPVQTSIDNTFILWQNQKDGPWQFPLFFSLFISHRLQTVQSCLHVISSFCLHYVHMSKFSWAAWSKKGEIMMQREKVECVKGWESSCCTMIDCSWKVIMMQVLLSC